MGAMAKYSSDLVAVANRQRRAAYEREMRTRRQARECLLQQLLHDAQSQPDEALMKWRRIAHDWRRQLSQCLGVSSPALPTRGRIIHARPGRYAIREWELNLDDDSVIPFLSLMPESRTRPIACLLLVPPLGERTGLGCRKEDLAERWGVPIVRAGFGVVIPDLPALVEASTATAKRLLLEGRTVVGEMVRQLMSLTNYLACHKDFYEHSLGIIAWGLSGWAGLLYAALDQRIAGAFIAMPTSMTIHGYVPALWQYLNSDAIAALIAPRPLAWTGYDDEPGADEDVNGRADELAYKLARTPHAHKRLELDCPEDVMHWFLSEGAIWAGPLMQEGILKHVVSIKPVYTAEPFKPAPTIEKVNTADEWHVQRKKLHDGLVRLLGGPRERCPLDAVVHDESVNDGIRYQRIFYHSERHAVVPAVMLTKDGNSSKMPTVICLPSSSQSVDDVARGWAREIVERGFNAFIVDPKPVRFARIAIDDFMEGKPMLGRMLWDVLAGVDYLLTRDDVDAERIGCVGVSMGGTLTWLATALDERIKVSAPAVGVATFESIIKCVRDETVDSSFLSYLDSHGEYYYVPSILRIGEQDAFIAMIAPRPLLILAMTLDNCFPLQGAMVAYQRIRHIYELLNAPDRIALACEDGPHGFPQELRLAAWEWLERWL